MYKNNCRKCGRHIPTSRGLRLCEWCEKAESTPTKNGTAINESVSHKELKDRATSFLLALGCHNVKQEVRKEFVYDVVGWSTKETYVIECGGSKKSKLDNILQKGYTLFIFPYGATEPIRYDKSMSICHCCGAITSLV